MSMLTLMPENGQVIVESQLLGALNVLPSDVLLFPTGLLGFPECRRFALLRGGGDGLFWLQSMEYSTLAFLLVDPFTIESDYSFDVQPSQIADLGPADPADVGLLSVVTLPANRDEQPTVNLQGPLIINFKTRQAKQVVSGDDLYGVRRPLDLARFVA